MSNTIKTLRISKHGQQFKIDDWVVFERQVNSTANILSRTIEKREEFGLLKMYSNNTTVVVRVIDPDYNNVVDREVPIADLQPLLARGLEARIMNLKRRIHDLEHWEADYKAAAKRIGEDILHYGLAPLLQSRLEDKVSKPITCILDTEMETFNKMRPQLIGAALGKYAVIYGRKLIGTFNDYEDALKAGYAEAKLQPFLVKQILEIDNGIISSRI